MALSATNIVKISQILLVPVTDINLWLTSFILSAEAQAAIEAQIVLWTAGPAAVTAYGRFRPKESNKGLETDPDRDLSRIAQQIAILLERLDWATGTSGTYLPRG